MDLKSSGYYNIEIDYNAYMYKNKEVILSLDIKNDEQYSLNIQGQRYFSNKKLKGFIKEVITRYKEKVDPDKIRLKLQELYNRKGFFNSVFDVGI